MIHRTKRIAASLVLGVTLVGLTFGQSAQASIVNDPNFFANTLARNDDLSTGLVNIGFTINFLGLSASQVYVNNNGNVTFNGPLGTFTPFPIVTTGVPIIAPFFGDVDTRNLASGITHYGQSTYNGDPAFGVSWAKSTLARASATLVAMRIS